jgi:hypothetical protein
MPPDPTGLQPNWQNCNCAGIHHARTVLHRRLKGPVPAWISIGGFQLDRLATTIDYNSPVAGPLRACLALLLALGKSWPDRITRLDEGRICE